MQNEGSTEDNPNKLLYDSSLIKDLSISFIVVVKTFLLGVYRVQKG